MHHNQPMAKRTVIIDDLTGDTGASTRSFRFDGLDYEIDLTDASYRRFKDELKPYLKVARQVGRTRESAAGRGRAARGRAKRAPSGPVGDAAAIRAWARSVGMAVTERGRVSSDVRAAWEAAGSPQ
jgi:hypothetical protein